MYSLLLSGLLAVCLSGGLYAQGDCGAGTTDVVVCFGNECADLAAEVCLPVFITNFTDLAGIQFALNYPDADLTFLRLAPTEALRGTEVSTPEAGLIQVVWNDATLTGVSVPADEPAYRLCFTANTESQAPVTANDPENSLRAFDALGNSLPMSLSPGVVNGADCGNGGGGMGASSCGEDTDAFTVCLGMACEVPAGGAACVPIHVGNFTEITALDFELSFPVANLTFDSVRMIADLPAALDAGARGDGLIRVSYFEPQQAGTTLADGAVIGEMCFTNTTAGTVSDLTPSEIVATNTSFETLETAGTSGRVNGCTDTMPTCTDGVQNGDETGVDCGGSCAPCPVGGTEPTFRITDGFGAEGSTTCLDVTVSGFDELTAFTLPIDFETDKATLGTITGVGPFSDLMLDGGSGGPVVVTWSGDPTSVADGTVAFTLCLDVQQQCSTPVTIARGGDRSASALDAGGNAVATLLTFDGMLNGGIPCGDAEPPRNLLMQLGSGTGGIGAEVCLDLTASDFSALTQLGFVLEYNPEILSFAGARNFGLPGLSAESITASPAGALAVDWAAPTAGGESLDDGSIVASFCFTVTQGSGTAVRFTDAPAPPSAVRADGADVRVVTTNGSINSDGQTIDDLTFEIGSSSGATGETVCLPVRGYGIDSLVSFQYTISYDSEVLEFIGQGSDVEFPLPGALLLNGASPGVIRVIWNDPNANGETNLPDGSILYTLCFRLRNENPTIIAFVDEPVPTEVLTVGGEQEVNLLNGQINGGDAPSILGSEVGDPTCSDLSNGFIVLQVAGEGTFTYAWEGTDAASEVANNLPAGAYTVIVSNPRGEADTMSFTLTAPPPFQVEVDNIDVVACGGGNTGSIRLATVGGTAPFLIDWGGDLADNVLEQSNLSGGSYSVTVTDANGCARQLRGLTVDEAEPLLIDGAIVGNAAGGEDVNVVTQGGTAPFQYSWSGPDGFTATTESISGLTTIGEYCVTVTDANSCTGMNCFEIGARDLAIDSVSVVSGTCAADGGTVVLSLGGGLAPYRITTQPGDVDLASTARRVELSLPGGPYIITVTDARDSVVMDTIEVVTPDALVADVILRSDTEDEGCTGGITLVPAGGTPDYTFTWSVDSTGASVSNLCAGSYAATLTDANGCTFTTGDIEIGRLVQTLDSISATACEDGTGGSASVTTSGGLAPYTFSWLVSGATDTISTAEDLVDVGPGDYTLTTTDSTGAQLVRSYTITNESGFTVASAVSTDFNGFGVSCPDAADGAITTAVSGEGTFTYEYILNDILVSADQNLVDAAAGTYLLRVMGDGGCVVVDSVIITAPPALATAPEVENVTCDDENDGRILIVPSGGVVPYRLNWSNGAVSPQLTDLDAGDYTLTLTDGNGCTLTETYSVTAPDGLAFTFEAVDATDDCNGAIEVLPLGGSGTFDYTWPELPEQGNSPLAEGLCPGDYTVIVADENGCQSVTMIATVRDRRFPCLSTRELLTPNQDGLNETLVIFCSGDDVAAANDIEVYNRWGQLVFAADDYDCSDNDGVNCFDGRTNDGTLLPDGAYYYIFNYTSPIGEREQLRGSFTLLRE